MRLIAGGPRTRGARSTTTPPFPLPGGRPARVRMRRACMGWGPRRGTRKVRGCRDQPTRARAGLPPRRSTALGGGPRGKCRRRTSPPRASWSGPPSVTGMLKAARPTAAWIDYEAPAGGARLTPAGRRRGPPASSGRHRLVELFPDARPRPGLEARSDAEAEGAWRHAISPRLEQGPSPPTLGEPVEGPPTATRSPPARGAPDAAGKLQPLSAFRAGPHPPASAP